MPSDLKLLEAALRMALKDPRSVGQRGLSLVLGANRIPPPAILPDNRLRPALLQT
jgi:hypothetical protein